MKKSVFYFVILVLMISGTNLFAQNKTTKPLMKIMVKDGVVIKAEPYDTTKSKLKISDKGAEGNYNPDKAIRKSTIEDAGYNPAKAVRTPKTEGNLKNLNTGVRTSTNENSDSRPGMMVPSSVKQDAAYDPNKAVRTSMNEDASYDPRKTSKASASRISTDTQVKEKGSHSPGKDEVTKAIFDPSLLELKKPAKKADIVKLNTGGEVQTLDGWESVISEGFEGAFPGVWSVYAESGYTDAYWEDVNYRSYTGSWSGFCAGGGTASVSPGTAYPSNMNAWMVYGPFDLSNANDGLLTFMLYNDSELSYDNVSWMVSTDGTYYYGYANSGSTGSWVSKSLDMKSVPTLGDVTGQSQVWVAFVFSSDGSFQYEGAYLDDILLQKYTVSAAYPNLTIPAIGLSSESWAVGSSITADVTVENIGTATADYHYTTLYLSTDTYISSAEDIQLGSDIYFNSISAGYSEVQSSTFTVPDVSDGYYYVGAIADYYDWVAESDETDNIVYRNLQPYVYHPAALPDLVWTYLTLSTDSWIVGNSVTADLTVENIGTGNADYQYSRIYLSTNNIISSSDVQLGSDLYFNSISAGYSQLQSLTFTVPDVSDGTYYIGALVDYYGYVSESDETNNGGARTGTVYITHITDQPDLTLTNIDLSSTTWVVGSSITADMTEENWGTGSAGAHYTTMYLSADTYISSSEDVQLGSEVYFGTIAAGGSLVQSATFTVPDVTDGTYYLGVIVDYYGQVAESDETNNVLYLTNPVTVTHVADYVDLSWLYMSLSTEIWNVGGSVTADLTEINYGNITAGSHYTRLYLSSNNIISSSDTQLGSDLSFGSIGGGGTLTVSETFTVPSVSDGTWYVGAIVDYYGEVTESDEANNALYRSGTVDICSTCTPLPDLEWTYLTLSADSWTVSTSETADLTIENLGVADAGAQYSRIYLSSNDIISSSDIQLGSDLTFGTIGAGGSLTVSETFTVPVVTDGTYYLGAIVDYYDNVQESNESNNGGTRTGTVYIGGGSTVLPDLEWTYLSFTTDSWIEGNGITADLTILNNSSTVSAGGQYSRIYLSDNDIISTADVQLGSDLYFNSIDPLVSQVQSLSFTVPYGNGTYYVGAIADIYNDVPESDETNNGGVRTGQVTITPNTTDLPDLAPTFIGLTTDQWSIGASITADVTEENFGTAAAGGYSSRLVLSDNTVISSADLQLGSDLYFSGIAAGSSLTVSKTFTVPDVTAGVYYVGIMTDVNNSIFEYDETNNIKYLVGTVNIIVSENTPDIYVTPAAVTINEAVSGASASSVLTESNYAIEKAIKHPGQSGPKYVPDRLIVKFKSDVGSNIISLNAADADLQTFNTKYKVSVIKQIGRSVKQLSAGNKGNVLLIKYESESDIYSVIEEFKKLDIVEYAEPDYIMKYDQDIQPDYVPNDPFYTNQWGLKNTGNAVSYSGGFVGTNGEDLNIEPAWEISMGSSSIIVAVIDCGIDLTHSEFSGRLVGGYDFVNGDSDPSALSTDGHGTSCSGIIGAANDGIGTVGVAPLVKIMPIKSMEDGTGSYSAIADGIYFAVDNGAKIISMSLGGSSYSLTLETAVNYAVNNGVVVLAAAGNDGTDNLVTPHYPSSFDNCISVGAMSPCGLRKTTTTCDGEFWWGSNFGDLDFITPGTRIYTTDNSGSGGYTETNYVEYFNGTSSACPFAAGVAALILSVNPSLTPAEVRLIMQNASVDVGTSGYDSETGYGRLDAYAALQAAQSGGTDLLTITNVGTGTLTVNSISQNKAWLTTSGYTAPFNLSSNESIVIQVNVNWSLLSASETGTITISSNDSDEAEVNIPVTANPLTVDVYNISVSVNPGTGGTVQGSGQYGLNQAIDLVAVPASQYNFVNWTESGGEVSTNTTYSFTVTSNRDLTANFVRITPTISASANPLEGGTIDGTGSYEYGTTATLTAAPAIDYQFVNWTEAGEVVSTNSIYSFTVTESRSLVANFSTDPYTITATSDPLNSGNITGAGNYLLSQAANLTAIPANGYEFVSWKENSTVVSVNSSYIFTVARNRVLVASFIVSNIDISASLNILGAGTVTGTGTFSYGNAVSLTATAGTSYHFVNWTESSIEVSKSTTYDFTATTDRVLIANFAINSYNISATVNPVNGGTVTGTGTYTDGENVTLSASPATGYHFVNWTENSTEVTTSSDYSFTATSDRTLVANFERNTYNITVENIVPASSGTVTGTGTYYYGTLVTVQAIPETGYHFLNWTVNGGVVSTDESYSFTIESNVALTVNFEINKYNISASVDPVGSGSVTGTGIYEHGTSITMEATPVTGYHFVSWTESSVVVSSDASYTFTATSDRTLIANFEINSYNIAASVDPPGSGTVTGTGIYNHWSDITLTASPATGYYFVNWTENDIEVSTSVAYDFTVTGERNLVANFAISAPTAKDAGNIVQTSFDAKWNSSVPATGYRLDVAEDNGFTSFVSGYNNKDVGNVTVYNVTGLNAKTPYYYRLRAYNTYKTSNVSNTIPVKTLSIPSSVPQGLLASSCNDLVTLTWGQSTGPDFIRYRIFGSTSSNPSTRIDSTATGITNTTKVIYSLVRGQTYYFRITAVNDDGVESTFSNQATVKVKTGVIPKIVGKWDNDVLICSNLGDSITSYQWYKDGSLITNATKQYYVTTMGAGTYNTETTDQEACRNSSNIIAVSGKKSLSVYPNPASEIFTVRLDNKPEGSAIISMINSSGIKVMEFQVENIKDELLKEVPVYGLDDGIYILKVLLNQEELYSTKIIIAK